MTYLAICFFSFLGTVNTSKFSVAVVVIGKEFHTTSTTTGFLLSFGVLMLGLGNLFWVVMLRIMGRRPVFLFAIPLIFVTNLWAYYAKSFGSLLASSIIGGFGAAAAEAPVSAVVADLFFVNERGTMLMIFHLALSCGFFVGPFLNAYVVQYAGWRWICGWLAIASAICWLIAFFTIHETAYRDRDVGASAEKFGPLRPYKSWLSVNRGYDKRVGFIRTTWNMIAVVGYPIVPWAGLVVGAFVGW
jgi:MFS family permease